MITPLVEEISTPLLDLRVSPLLIICISSPSKKKSSAKDLLIKAMKIIMKYIKNFFIIYFSLILTNPMLQNKDIINKGNHMDKNSGSCSFSPSRLEK